MSSSEVSSRVLAKLRRSHHYEGGEPGGESPAAYFLPASSYEPALMRFPRRALRCQKIM